MANINAKSVIKYLEANGVTVQGNTDNYFRLSGDKFKAWTPPIVLAEPTIEMLAVYNAQVATEETAEKEVNDVFDSLAGSDAKLARLLEDALVILKNNHNIDLEAQLPAESKGILIQRREAREKVKGKTKS